MMSATFMRECMVVLRDYIDNDPKGIEQAFIAILYKELTGSETSEEETSRYFSCLLGRYRSPRMKNALGSAIEILKINPPIESVTRLVDLMFELRGPSLTAAEFIAELMSNGLVPNPNSE